MNKEPHIMSVETSGRLGSVALAAGSDLLCERQFTAMRAHASELLPTMAALCREVGWQSSDIEHFYLSVGPGSFTGLRIAVTVAKALSFAQPVKIVAVPSMEVLVMNALDAAKAEGVSLGQVALAVDAKRRQIFTGLYDWLGGENNNDSEDAGFARGFSCVLPSRLLKPAELLDLAGRPLCVLGEGLAQHSQAFEGIDGVLCLNERYWAGQARHVHSCGWRRAKAGLFSDAETLLPVYLRRPEAIERWEKEHGVG